MGPELTAEYKHDVSVFFNWLKGTARLLLTMEGNRGAGLTGAIVGRCLEMKLAVTMPVGVCTSFFTRMN